LLGKASREDVRTLERLGILTVVKFRRRGQVVYPGVAVSRPEAEPDGLMDVLFGKAEQRLSRRSHSLLDSRGFQRRKMLWFKRYGSDDWKSQTDAGVVLTLEETGGFVWMTVYGPHGKVFKMGAVSESDVSMIVPRWDDWYSEKLEPTTVKETEE
jgi:hypothetical protein